MSDELSAEEQLGQFVRFLRARLSRSEELSAEQLRSEFGPLGDDLLKRTTLGRREPARLPGGGEPPAGGGSGPGLFLDAAQCFLEQLAAPDNFGAAFRHAAIDAVLRKYSEDEMARSDRVQGSLEPCLRERLVALAAQIEPLAPSQPSFDAGWLELDEVFALCLDTVGDGGRLISAKVRASSAERAAAWREGRCSAEELFRLWLPPEGQMAPRFASALAEALWLDEVRPRLERAKAKPPALVMAVHEPVMRLLSRTAHIEQREGQQVLRFSEQGHALLRSPDPAAIDAQAINHLMVHRGLKLFGSVTAHRVLRWQIFTGHRQAIEGHPDPRVLSVDGGWATLAHEVLGMKGKRAADEVRDIIEAEDACQIPLPPENSYSRLLIRSYQPPQGRRRGSIKLVLGFHLLPDYVQQLRQSMGASLEARRALRLVPVLELPPFAGNRANEHGAQASLSMAVVAHMRDHARELVDQGGVHLDEQTLTPLALQVGLPPSMLSAVLRRWTEDGEDGPAFLKPIGPGRYTLGDAHTAARSFLEQGGKAEQDGSEAGQRGVKSKRGKLLRLGKRRLRLAPAPCARPSGRPPGCLPSPPTQPEVHPGRSRPEPSASPVPGSPWPWPRAGSAK